MAFIGRPEAIAFTALLATALLSGCGTLGPNSIRASRTDYNVALRQTEDEQLLLNIVRLRYGDRPLFLINSSISESVRISPNIGVSGSFPQGAFSSDSYSANASLNYSEGPTVSYHPLQGQEFAKRVLTRVSMETLMLLGTSGWNVERVFRTCVQSVNNISNAVAAAGPTPEREPEYATFLKMSDLLLAFELRDLIRVHDREVGGKRRMYLKFLEKARSMPEYDEFTQMLGLNPRLKEFHVTTDQSKIGGDTISVRTRSFAGVLFYLSQSVGVPARDEVDGLVQVTLEDNGRPFDWTQVTKRLFKVSFSDGRPGNAAVAVEYRDEWFYIDDADLASKWTFSMISQLFAMQSETGSYNAPVLTLPIGG